MKRSVIHMFVLLLLAGGATGQEVRNPADAVHTQLGGYRSYEEEPPEPPLPADLPPGAKALVERLLAREYTLHASVFHVDAGALPFAGPNRPRLRSLIEDGRAKLLRVTSVTGRAGPPHSASSIGRRHAVLRFALDSAQAVVATDSMIDAVQHGLWLVARFGIVPGRGVRVRYRVVFADPPEIEQRDTVAGKLDYTSVPVLFADGGTVLRVGETVYITSGERTRNLVVALTLSGPEEPIDAVVDLGDGGCMAVGGHLLPPLKRRLPLPVNTGLTSLTLWRVKRDAEPDGPLQADLKEAGFSPPDWHEGPQGLSFGRPDAPNREHLRAILRREAEIRAERGTVKVGRFGRRGVVLPVSPGERYRVFHGRLTTEWGGISTQSGCSSASGAVPVTRFTFDGVAVSGKVGLRGPDDLTMIGREILSTEWYETSLRRTLPTFDGYARDEVRIPLVTDRVFAYGGPLPPGGDLPGNTRVEIRCARPGGAAGVMPVTVKGIDAALAPGWTTILLDIERRRAVTRWESEGWCGMRIRYPLTGVPFWVSMDADLGQVPWPEVWSGYRATLTPLGQGDAPSLHLSIEGECRGPAESLGRFDPLDGEVELVRQPRLVFETCVRLDGGGPIAWCPGLTFDVRRLGHEYGFRAGREITCRTEAGETGFVCTDKGRLEAGGTTILPQGFHEYVSHVAGEVTTEFGEVTDGLGLAFTDRRLELEWSTRPVLTPRKAGTENSPPRSGDGLRTIDVARREVRRVWRLNRDGTLDIPPEEGIEVTVRGVR